MRKSAPVVVSERILDDYIKNSALSAGDKLPTVRELAERYAPISNNTLVHALSILESSGWICKRQGSGCYISEPPADVDPNQPDMVGFIAPVLSGRLLMDLHAGTDEVCKLYKNYVLMSAAANESVEEEREQVRRMVKAGCTSVILYPVVRNADQLKSDYLANEFRDVKIILVDMAYPSLNRDRVIFDNQQSGFDMTQYLIKRGHKKISFMNLARTEPEVVNYSVARRYRGFIEAVSLHSGDGVEGCEWTLRNRTSEFSHSWGDMETDLQEKLHDSLVEWKKMEHRPTAVIAIEDYIAMALINVARALDIEVHKDLTVVGFDNLVDPQLMYPLFTTTNPNFRMMGQIAARVACQDEFENGSQQKTYILQAPVLERKMPDHS